MGSADRFDAFASTPDAFENLFAQPGTDLLDHGITRRPMVTVNHSASLEPAQASNGRRTVFDSWTSLIAVEHQCPTCHAAMTPVAREGAAFP
jgi:hypothetical protein